jgi:hypothetical protein
MSRNFGVTRPAASGAQPLPASHNALGAQRNQNSSADDRELAALLFASVVLGAPLVFGAAVYLFLVE